MKQSVTVERTVASKSLLLGAELLDRKRRRGGERYMEGGWEIEKERLVVYRERRMMHSIQVDYVSAGTYQNPIDQGLA